MLETKSDILSTTSGANSTTFISDITQSERTSTLDFHLVKSSVASVSKADTGILPVPPAGHALVTPSAAEDILSAYKNSENKHDIILDLVTDVNIRKNIAEMLSKEN